MRPVPLLDPSRISVVLGGGSVLGASYHVGVLHAIHDVWGVDPRQIHSIVGTSSGAIVAGHVAAGLSTEDLYLREAGDPVGVVTGARIRRARDQGRSADAESSVDRAQRPWPANPILSLKAGFGRTTSPGLVLAGLLPRGRQSHSYLESYFDELLDHEWPARPQLRLCTVDLSTGDRIVVDHRSRATPGKAIAASCALPGLHRPVSVDGRELIDGAVYSVDNADLANRGDTDLILVSSPLSTERLLGPAEPLALARNTITMTSRSTNGPPSGERTVIELRPRLADVRMMGTNLATTDQRQRRRVAKQAYQTTQKRLANAAAAPTPT